MTLTDEQRIEAVRLFLTKQGYGDTTDDIEPNHYDETRFDVEHFNLLVLSDDEADALHHDRVESIIDDTLEVELSKLELGDRACYITVDREAYHRDTTDRGASIASDGEEYDVQLANGDYVYLYEVD